MSDTSTPKRSRRTKESFDEEYDEIAVWKSKKFGSQFDALLVDGKPSDRVVCKDIACRAILNKCGTTGLRFHIKNNDSSRTVSQESMKEALLKFVVASGQPISAVDDPRFVKFIESFRKLAIDAYDARSRKSAKDFLPSRNTMRKRIDERLDSAKEEVVSKLELLKTHGGGITLDFAKKGVDYIAMTGHFIDKNWVKQDFVLSFSPVEAGAKKTSRFVQDLVNQELSELGIGRHELSKIFFTTDEGSNVCCVGGENHLPCLCHIGSTIAKRSTRLYKDSRLKGKPEIGEACSEVECSLHVMEKWVNKLRQDEMLMKEASRALKSPAETRWLSYFNMVEALVSNLDILRNAVMRICPTNETALALLDLASKSFFNDYLSVLFPIHKMVLVMQGEIDVTTSGILLHIATIWLSLSDKRSRIINSKWSIAMAEAAMEAFERKIGDLSNDWLTQISGKLNKKLVISSAFLCPFTHCQLRSVCSKIPGWDYEEMKKIVRNYAEAMTSEEEQSTIKGPGALFDFLPPTPLEGEIIMYSLTSPCNNVLKFWKQYESMFPRLSVLARLLFG